MSCTPQNTTSSTHNGIDIQSALKILSERQPNASQKDHDCKTPSILHPTPHPIGQVIDFSSPAPSHPTKSTPPINDPTYLNFACPCVLNVAKDEQAKDAQAKDEQTKDEQTKDEQTSTPSNADYKAVSTLPFTTIIHQILSTQSSRLTIYNTYNATFNRYLLSPSFPSSRYMELVAGVTVQFTVLSKVYNVLREEARKRYERETEGGGQRENVEVLKGIVEAVDKMQLKESSKLRLTAALHLSHIRMREVVGTGDVRTVGLIEDEIKKGRQEIARVEEEIEEWKEEVREGLLIEVDGKGD